MLYLIYGTNLAKRKIAERKIEELLKKKGLILKELLEVSRVSGENYQTLENHFLSGSLFGERLLVRVENLLDKKDSREYLYSNLENLVKSENIFLLDEPNAAKISVQKVIRDLGKLGSGETFEAVEEIKKKDIEPFHFCELVVARNKKAAWEEWKKIYLEWGDSEAMALHGALWWKWKTLWTSALNYKNPKFSLKEIEKYGREIAFLAMSATSGEANLMRGIEKLVLSL